MDSWCVVGIGGATGSGVWHTLFASLVTPRNAVPWISEA